MLLIWKYKLRFQGYKYIHAPNRIDADNDGSVVGGDPLRARFYGSHLTDFGDLLCIALLSLLAVSFVSCDSFNEGELLWLTCHV